MVAAPDDSEREIEQLRASHAGGRDSAGEGLWDIPPARRDEPLLHTERAWVSGSVVGEILRGSLPLCRMPAAHRICSIFFNNLPMFLHASQGSWCAPVRRLLGLLPLRNELSQPLRPTSCDWSTELSMTCHQVCLAHSNIQIRNIIQMVLSSY